MRAMPSSVLILILLLGVTPALAQLSPEILADSHLLRAEQAIRDDDKDRARAEIDKITLLQKEHELDLVEKFHFRLATAAGTVDLPEQALESVTKYLSAAGRDGPHYVEALELMNRMQDAIAAGKESPVQASSQVPIEAQPGLGGTPRVQAEQRELLNTVETTTAPLVPECDLTAWNTERYFKTATVQDVNVCIESGADPKARDKSKITPLHWAVDNENLAVVEALLAAGADVNARDDDKETSLHWALDNENLAVVEVLLAAGANVNASCKYKETPLYWAVDNENLALVEVLLAAGADVKDPQGFIKDTPLHVAAKKNKHPAVVEALLAAGAEVKYRNLVNDTPLHSAAGNNENLAVVEVLLAAGADVNARSIGKNTPLHEAAGQNKNPAVVRTLVVAGADVNSQNDSNDTPLHEAARTNENPAVVHALLAVGADLGAQNKQGDTPLRVATKDGRNPPIGKALLAAGGEQVERRLAAARAREESGSGPGWLEAAIGIAGGAAIAAAGGGSEEALAAGTVFAEGVISGQPAVGSAAGGYSSTPTSADGSSSDFGDALRNLENSCGERYRSAFSPQDHGRFYCLDAFARYCALKQGHNQQQLDALKHDFEVLRSQGQESRCPYFGVLGGTYNENQPALERPQSDPETKPTDPVTQERPRTTCADGDTVPIAVERGEKPGCPSGRWCLWNACRSNECRQRYPECAPGVLR